MFPKIAQVIDKIDFDTISTKRKLELEVLTHYIVNKRKIGAPVQLNFICTHNSRRSQLSQLWANVAAVYYDIKVACYSGGTEETAFNKRAISSLNRFGFKISKNESNNPIYSINWDKQSNGLDMFSKIYDNKSNPSDNFAAIMTCSHADENCPFVVGCDARIQIRYEDPKKYDNTPLESSFYDYRSFEIATEMFYVFSKINKL
jgi:arsenate reductase